MEKSDELVEVGEEKLDEERLYEEEPVTKGPGEGKSEKEETGGDELSDDDGLCKDGSGNRVFWKEWPSVDELVEDDQLRDLGALENGELDLGDLGTLENGELISGAKP